LAANTNNLYLEALKIKQVWRENKVDDQEKMTLRVRASMGFRPGAPINKLSLFSGRSSQINDVMTATLQPGQHVIIFGERGVGKTSLAKIISEVLSNAGVTVLDSGTINCDGTDDFSMLWHKVFRELSMVMQTKQVGFANESPERSTTTRFSLESRLPEIARPDDIRYVLSQVPQETIIIIDEVDRIKDRETTRLLSDTIKNLSDHSVNTTIILVGVADSVEGLIAEHKSIERSLVQIPMPRMSRIELIQIIDKSLQFIGMTIDEDAKKWISRLSQGLPFYTHSLALYSAHTAINNDRSNIIMSDVADAISTTVQKAYTILSVYNKATSSPQRKNLYSKVLLSCALAISDELGFFSAAAVSKPMSAIMGKKFYVPNFSRHLFDFCDENRGAILQKVGTPRRFRFRFLDPMMQPFVILHGLSTGELTKELLEKALGS
jgi:Holliday junction resolvasome RuvABC ATP-dependent DNA helicase subunit